MHIPVMHSKLKDDILRLHKDQLMQIGINPDNIKEFKYIDREGKYGLKGIKYKFDIVVSNDYVDAIAVKFDTSKDDVEWFNEKVERMKGLLGKLRNKIIVTIYTDAEALDRAKEIGVNVIYSYLIPLEEN